ncbi:hypothetical protein HXX76_011439 [Chlamydomonas incerta]|uniref:Uncharacterized protein n=1 Tax=Chlamydomonas incerta TaxID=51695 RepID=A0A835SZG4_CHLIN|nr:hypothetical protein HXX76_011439 [Chlamydomonas incerta]|eukprot:KAG2428736.1 hypothetical protein HXX76_011439 [Chlamydomonas incerta]
MSGVLENLQLALTGSGLDEPLAGAGMAVLAAAAGAGRLEVCRFIVTQDTFKWGFGDAITAAARAGHSSVLNWLLSLPPPLTTPPSAGRAAESAGPVLAAAATSGDAAVFAAVLAHHTRPAPPGAAPPLPRDWYPMALAAAAQAGREALLRLLLRPALWRALVPRPRQIHPEDDVAVQLAYDIETLGWETRVLEAVAEGCSLACLQQVAGATAAWQWPAAQVQQQSDVDMATEAAAAEAAVALAAAGDDGECGGGPSVAADAQDAAAAAAAARAWAAKRGGLMGAGKVLAAAARSRTADWRSKAEWLESAAGFRFPAPSDGATLAALGTRPLLRAYYPDQFQQRATGAQLREAAMVAAVGASSLLQPAGDDGTGCGPGGKRGPAGGQQRGPADSSTQWGAVVYSSSSGRASVRRLGCCCAGCSGADAAAARAAVPGAAQPPGEAAEVGSGGTPPAGPAAACMDVAAGSPGAAAPGTAARPCPLCTLERVSWLLARGLEPDSASLAAAASLPRASADSNGLASTRAPAAAAGPALPDCGCGGCGRHVLRLLLAATPAASSVAHAREGGAFPVGYVDAMGALQSAGNVAWLLDVCRWEVGVAAAAAAAMDAAAAAVMVPAPSSTHGSSAPPAADDDAWPGGNADGRTAVRGGGGARVGSRLLRQVVGGLQEGGSLVMAAWTGQLQLVVWMLRQMRRTPKWPAPPLPRMPECVYRPRQPRPKPVELSAGEERAAAEAWWDGVWQDNILAAMQVALSSGDVEVSPDPEPYLLAASKGDLAALAALRRLRYPVDWHALPGLAAARQRIRPWREAPAGGAPAAGRGLLGGLLRRWGEAQPDAVNLWVREAAKQETAGVSPAAELEMKLRVEPRQVALAKGDAGQAAGGSEAPAAALSGIGRYRTDDRVSGPRLAAAAGTGPGDCGTAALLLKTVMAVCDSWTTVGQQHAACARN